MKKKEKWKNAGKLGIDISVRLKLYNPILTTFTFCFQNSSFNVFWTGFGRNLVIYSTFVICRRSFWPWLKTNIQAVKTNPTIGGMQQYWNGFTITNPQWTNWRLVFPKYFSTKDDSITLQNRQFLIAHNIAHLLNSTRLERLLFRLRETNEGTILSPSFNDIRIESMTLNAISAFFQTQE